jgi:hypothetical protein
VCKIISALSLAFLSGFLLQAADKPNFTGTWRLEGGESQSSLTIKQSEGDIQVSAGSEADSATQVNCNTMGRECEAQVGGEEVKVTYYYNGPMLVEMVYGGKNGDRVTKTRRTLSADGAKMLVEVVPMAPAGKAPTKFVYLRDSAVNTAKSPEARHQ